jgi:hypothetical protein
MSDRETCDKPECGCHAATGMLPDNIVLVYDKGVDCGTIPYIHPTDLRADPSELAEVLAKTAAIAKFGQIKAKARRDKGACMTADAMQRYSKAKPIEGTVAVAARNDPCPCGSGKKFKKCCIKKTAIRYS